MFNKKLFKFKNLIYRFDFFFRKNIKKFSFTLLVFLLVITTYFIYYNFYVKSRQEKALNYFFYAKKYFLQNEIKKALGEDSYLKKSGYMGFIDIINEFPSTPAANISRFYAGLSNYILGNYEKSLKFWKDFYAKDELIFPMKYGIIADIYVHLNKNKEAIKYYIKAIKAKSNDFTTPFYIQKTGILLLSMKKYNQAKNYFLLLKEKYPKNFFSNEVDKYLSLIDTKIVR